MALAGETLDYVDREARISVRAGYDSLDAIRGDLIELVEYDPDSSDAFAADPQAARRQVAEIVARHAEDHAREEADFPPLTDPDRLTAVFAQLQSDGIVARECVGITSSDVNHEMWALLDEQPDARGWVAFHRQDVERVVETGLLFLAYAHRSDRDEDFAVLGREVAERLTAAGFDVVWDGDPTRRLELHDVKWLRRRS